MFLVRRSLMMILGKIEVYLAIFFFVSATAHEQRPVALVFENTLYQKRLSDTGIGSVLDLVDCSTPGSCNPPAADIAKRVVAYVAALPRNLSVLSELPNLKLYQSVWYNNPLGGIPTFGYPFQSPDAVPSHVTVANWVGYPYEQSCYIMADWVAASMFRWNFQLAEKEAAFRNCAWEADSPQHCPPLTSLSGQHSLRGMTFGIIGYGKVGSAMADVMSKLGMRVIASKVKGPFTPTPSGLAWLSGDNDRVWRESDFVVVSVPLHVPVINKTSLSLMKPTAVLVPVHSLHGDELDSLYEALSSHSIGGAFLDSWGRGCMAIAEVCGPPYGARTWPTIDKRFLELDNVQITANNLDQDDAFWDFSAKSVSANLRNLLTGCRLSGIVRKSNLTGTSASTNIVSAHVTLMEPHGQGTQAFQDGVSWAASLWAFQLGMFGITCFGLGVGFASCALPIRQSVRSAAFEVNKPVTAEYMKMVA